MYRTILVPLDGSPLAERALPYAKTLAKAHNARLLLVRAMPGSAAPGIDPGSVNTSPVRDAEQYLSAIATGVAQPFVVETAVFPGNAADSIVEEIGLRQVDLVVMSTHGRSGLGRLVFGSVADEILHRVRVPVLLVPAHAAGAWPVDRAPRLLAPLDGSDLARGTIDHISDLIDSLGAEIHLLQVIVPRPYTFADAAAYLANEYTYADAAVYGAFGPANSATAARDYLTDVARELESQKRRVFIGTAFGPAASMIALAAARDGVDLIAMSTHGAGGLTRLLMGSVATGVVQHATVPVLILRSGSTKGAAEAVATHRNVADAQPVI